MFWSSRRPPLRHVCTRTTWRSSVCSHSIVNLKVVACEPQCFLPFTRQQQGLNFSRIPRNGLRFVVVNAHLPTGFPLGEREWVAWVQGIFKLLNRENQHPAATIIPSYLNTSVDVVSWWGCKLNFSFLPLQLPPSGKTDPLPNTVWWTSFITPSLVESHEFEVCFWGYSWG